MSEQPLVDESIRHEIAGLVADFTWKLDNSAPDGFAGLFTADGAFIAAGKEHRGAEDLQRFAEARTAQDKVSRTFLGAHRLIRVADDEVTGTLPYILFMGPGEGPRTPDVFAVGEYVDTYRLEGGSWRIARRSSSQVFTRR